MNILRSLAPLVFSLIILSGSCKKNNVQPQSELSKLPFATQIGANTIGCLINGKAFVPQNRSILQGPSIQCNYIYLNGGYSLTVSGDNKNGDGSLSSIILQTDSLAINEGQTIKLTDYNVSGKAVGEYNIFNDPYYDHYYRTNDHLTGQLTITKLDQTKQIVSGTFYFNVLSSAGDTIKITDGRFDMLYTR